MRKRSITLKGHRTSVALEDEFWATLERFADEDGRSLASLIGEIDRERMKRLPPPGLASALRVYVLRRTTGA
ncbi:MAG: ribbon-helix-helix domain-containing protein [Hyphococcus sp.]